MRGSPRMDYRRLCDDDNPFAQVDDLRIGEEHGTSKKGCCIRHRNYVNEALARAHLENIFLARFLALDIVSCISGTDKQSDRLDSEQPLWGAAAIARFIGLSTAATYDLLERGKIPGRKIGAKWVALPSELQQALSSSRRMDAGKRKAPNNN
jgi:hypothetical protein